MPVGQPLIIDRQFNGPPDSGNGGYVCGVVAAQMISLPPGTLPEVMLKAPPPLDTTMSLVHEGETWALRQGDRDIAAGRAVTWSVRPPALPPRQLVDDAGKLGEDIRGPIFPTCMVCGQNRHDHYGLRIMAGQVAGQNYLAAPWTPHTALADTHGTVKPEFVWAALDCPSGFAVTGGSNMEKPTVLGTFSVDIKHLPQAGQPCGIVAWMDSREGRKAYSYAALYDTAGTVLATAKATWIELKS